MKAQEIPSDTEASFTDKKEKKRKNNTVKEKFKVNGSIKFKINNFCDMEHY